MKRVALFCIMLFCSCLLQAQAEPPPPPPPPPSITDTTVTITYDTSMVVYGRVQVEASYPGGEKAWRKYLEKSLIFNETMDRAVKKRISEGTYTIVIRFLVDINGRINDVKALTNYGYGLEEGAIEIIKKSGKWTPAIQDNMWVNSYRTQPITFYFKNF